jgi:hypothetical protein
MIVSHVAAGSQTPLGRGSANDKPQPAKATLCSTRRQDEAEDSEDNNVYAERIGHLVDEHLRNEDTEVKTLVAGGWDEFCTRHHRGDDGQPRQMFFIGALSC